jgi:predicted phage tail protein
MAITADITNSSDFITKKPEINSSLMPMVSYNPNQSTIEQGAEEVQGQKTMGRRMSEMDFMAAITQLAPDVEAGPATPGSGGRKEMYDSVL